ncbi:MAG: DNA-formamidopyrimidine glycosylase [Pseudanabaena sp. ELA607]|jgi:formamidopyrimidine-DNA glycosylase
MPELPEVETVRRGLVATTPGWEITACEVLLAKVIAPPTNARELSAIIQGGTIDAWERRGKYLLGTVVKQGKICGQLGVHLRMTGSLRWCDVSEPVGRHTRVRFWLQREQAQKELRFDDQRTFGRLWWVPADASTPEIMTGLGAMGLEPFDPAFTPSYLWQQLRTRRRAIKTLLLDQTIVAGIGNIYADEALFCSGIHPEILGQDLASHGLENHNPDELPPKIVALHQAIIQVLQAGIDHGGTTFSSFQDVAGLKGNYIDHAWVFRRTGQPCRVCQTAIVRLKIGGRSSHFCPQCQPF